MAYFAGQFIFSLESYYPLLAINLDRHFVLHISIL